MCEVSCEFGGVTGGGYNTPFNTIGVGDPVPFGINSYGSGDLFGQSKKSKSLKIATKKPAQNYCQELPLVVMAKK